MILETLIGNTVFRFNTSEGIEISITLDSELLGPNCFYAPPFDASPLVSGTFVGDTRQGSPVNFYNVRINPHGNGTHTECVGHISTERISIAEVLRDSLFTCRLVSVYPDKLENGDKVISAKTMQMIAENLLEEKAIIIRTLPNPAEKERWTWSGTNPPYFEASGLQYLLDKGIEHLLTDLPSVDREEDGGRLEAHKIWWNYPQEINRKHTITEMVYIPDQVKDGSYLLQIQIPPFQLDAAPSRVFIFKNLV